MLEIDLKKSLVASVIVFFLIAAFYGLGGRIPYVGQLPGDIAVAQGNTVVIIPIASSILLSLILSLVFYLIDRNGE